VEIGAGWVEAGVGLRGLSLKGFMGSKRLGALRVNNNNQGYEYNFGGLGGEMKQIVKKACKKVT
jgi:hypothetical protein